MQKGANYNSLRPGNSIAIPTEMQNDYSISLFLVLAVLLRAVRTAGRAVLLTVLAVLIVLILLFAVLALVILVIILRHFNFPPVSLGYRNIIFCFIFFYAV